MRCGGRAIPAAQGAHRPGWRLDRDLQLRLGRRLTNVSSPTLTVFPAPKNPTPSPAIIVCPGGGYSYVVHDKEGTEIAAWLNSAGITALVLKYRVPNNRDGALQDVQRALSLARADADKWNIDPKRLGVIGFSAGGHLAAKACTGFDPRTYAAIDAVDQQSCRPDFVHYPANPNPPEKVKIPVSQRSVLRVNSSVGGEVVVGGVFGNGGDVHGMDTQIVGAEGDAPLAQWPLEAYGGAPGDSRDELDGVGVEDGFDLVPSCEEDSLKFFHGRSCTVFVLYCREGKFENWRGAS